MKPGLVLSDEEKQQRFKNFHKRKTEPTDPGQDEEEMSGEDHYEAFGGIGRPSLEPGVGATPRFGAVGGPGLGPPGAAAPSLAKFLRLDETVISPIDLHQFEPQVTSTVRLVISAKTQKVKLEIASDEDSLAPLFIDQVERLHSLHCSVVMIIHTPDSRPPALALATPCSRPVLLLYPNGKGILAEQNLQ